MGVPVAQIDVEKSYNGEFWTNRYLVDIAPNAAGAPALISAIVAAERTCHYSAVFFTKVRHRTLAVGDDDFSTTQIGYFGTRAIGTEALIPLFNVVRVDFSVGDGRPSRKYLRGCITETDFQGDVLTGTILSGIMPQYINGIVAIQNVVDPQGDDLVSGQVILQVAMRQLRRGTRRRSGPVL